MPFFGVSRRPNYRSSRLRSARANALDLAPKPGDRTSTVLPAQGWSPPTDRELYAGHGPSAPERSRIGRWSSDQPLLAIPATRSRDLPCVATTPAGDDSLRRTGRTAVSGKWSSSPSSVTAGYSRVAVVEESDCVENGVDYQLARDAVAVAGYGAGGRFLCSHGPHEGLSSCRHDGNKRNWPTERQGLAWAQYPDTQGAIDPVDRQHAEDESRRCASASCHRPLDRRRSRHDAL